MKLAAILRHEMAHLDGADEVRAYLLEAEMFRKLRGPAPHFVRQASRTQSSSGAGPPRFPLTPNSRLDLPQAGGEPQTTAVAYSLFRRDFVCGHALAARGSRSRFEASPPVGGSRGAGRVRL